MARMVGAGGKSLEMWGWVALHNWIARYHSSKPLVFGVV